MANPPRSRDQRKHDTLGRLDRDIDIWAATADSLTDTPYLIPLSFLWDGTSLILSTPAAGPTGRNLRASGRVRLGLGLTRDVALIEGTVQETIPPVDVPAELGDEFAAKTGLDPREQADDYLYFRVRPSRIQAWREANELTGRDLMRDGEWL